MIAMKSNPSIRPAYCISRHHCLKQLQRKCEIGCSWWDFQPRTGDAHKRRDAETGNIFAQRREPRA